MPPPPGLAPYLVLQNALDRDMLENLQLAFFNADRELNKLSSSSRQGIGNRVRQEQLLRTQAALHQEMSRLWQKQGDVVEAARHASAAAGASTVLEANDSLLANVFSEADRAYMAASARASAARGVEVLLERVSGTSYVPLAESVYNQTNLTNGTIDRIINNAIARGASAADLAKDVRAYINPNTPGGVKYASLRLGRTELNNAFHAAQVRQSQAPWVEGVRWHLSGSHPKPDECNDYADQQHVKGWEAGVFRPEEVPTKPHPNCLCYTTPVEVGEEEFIQAFQEGQYNAYLDEHFPELPDASEPEPSGPFGRFARQAPQSYAEAFKSVNPHTGQEYRNNCHFVVNAMEMRARGHDVVAAQTFKSEGRWAHSISRDWVDPATGEARPFTQVAGNADGYVNVTKIKQATDDWPPGARGYIRGTWRKGGGHIWNVYKDAKGNIKTIDGQVQVANANSYLDKMKNVSIMRVDDLEPTERVSHSLAKPLSAENPVNAANQLRSLENIISQLEEDFRSLDGFREGNLRNSMVDLLQVLRKEQSLIKSRMPTQPLSAPTV